MMSTCVEVYQCDETREILMFVCVRERATESERARERERESE